MRICLYPDDLRFRTRSATVAQTSKEMLQIVGSIVSEPVVIEADLGEDMAATLESSRDDTNYLSGVPDPATPPTVDQLLQAVSEQTSLKLERQQREVPTWRIVQAGN
jgi:hypothetical protein